MRLVGLRAMEKPAPIVLFVFNRPEHTRRTLESLKKNALARESDLFVYSDGARSPKDDRAVAQVRSLIDRLSGFKTVTITKSEVNVGLAGSVIKGVTEILQDYGRAIVIEDDLQFAPFFLDYMNEALRCYRSDGRVFSIGGYSPPIEIPTEYTEDSYLSYRCCTWGWGTWLDRWKKVDWHVKDFDRFVNDQESVRRFNRGGEDMIQILKLQMAGKISSWGIRWDYAHFKYDAYCFRPVRSLVSNIGNDGSGVHCGVTEKFDVVLNPQSTFHFPEPGQLQVSEWINAKFASFYDGKNRDEKIRESRLGIRPYAILKAFFQRLW